MELKACGVTRTGVEGEGVMMGVCLLIDLLGIVFILIFS